MTSRPDARPAGVAFTLLTIDDLDTLSDPAWLIEGVMPEAALVELYGAEGAGKSFLALDWALSVATSETWQGRAASPGDVVYVSAEGGRGMRKRIAAWRQNHPGATDIRFYAVLTPVSLPDGGEVESLVRAIREAPCHIRLVVIDTLARCFGDGDENATKDMNAFVVGADRIKAAFPRSTVLVVHHSGKNVGKRDRGSTVLRAAADTVMELSARGGGKSLNLKCEKQKDWEPFDAIHLRLQGVALDGGDTSCVVEARTVGPVSAEPRHCNDSDARALDALREAREDGLTYSQWRDASKLPPSTFKSARKRLLDRKVVHRDPASKIYRAANANKGQGQGQGESQALSLTSSVGPGPGSTAPL